MPVQIRAIKNGGTLLSGLPVKMGLRCSWFTHTVQMDWMLPGVAPTGERSLTSVTPMIHANARGANGSPPADQGAG